MTTFQSLKQTSVKFIGTQTYSTEELLALCLVANEGQFDINPAKVKSILTSLVKSEPLHQMPVVAYVAGNEASAMVVSGRHRFHAINQFCSGYALSPNGKVVKRTVENSENVEHIEPFVECMVYEVPTKKELIDLVLSYNESRTAPASEKAFSKAYAGTATPGEQLKQKFAAVIDAHIQDMLRDEDFTPAFIPTVDANGVESAVPSTFSITPQTIFNMAAAVGAKVKTLKYATQEQLEAIARAIVDQLQEPIPANISREYKIVIEAMLDQECEWEDKDGDAVEGTYAEHLNSVITKPISTAKVSKQTEMALLEAKLQEMVAKLAAAGIAT